jgi:predicted DNA-binding transcriptional regulator AlpA
MDLLTEVEVANMVPRSKSRSSRAPRRNKQPSLDRQPLPATLHDAQVLTIRQWSQLAGISPRTAKRLFKAGGGPQRVQLSSNRTGVTLAAHKAWLESRTRGAVS